MTGITLDRLRIFLAVAEQMHFTRAAEVLYMTQSSVSSAIQNLEEHYGLKLFDRIGRHIEITAAGRLLKIEAQKILEQVNLTERGLRELNNLQRGELKLGASLTIGNYWLPNKISEFKRQYPGIEIYCTLGNTAEIITGTVEGQFDLGFVEGNVSSSAIDALEIETISSDRLLIVVGQSHPWFSTPRVSLTALTQTTWVMREPGSGTRAVFEQALREWGIDPKDLNVVLAMSSGEMVKAVVEDGVGVTAISELMIKKELQLNSLRSVQIEELGASTQIARSFVRLKHRQRFQTLISQAFTQLLNY
ncbi:LysR family transcriptional regulator [Myxosarcina sp. GI1]|uniref:LysR family transcriptional regulator n=1 Tax=Myxosarcina sp. GI1 TaxID=1541065 RepID=UPI00055F8FDB|nr:LysR family transcriptional regulator [Myxosarcina sp. GI1]